jgi:hypothetical protein
MAPKADYRHKESGEKASEHRRLIKNGKQILGLFVEPSSRPHHERHVNRQRSLVRTVVDPKNTTSDREKCEKEDMDNKMFKRIAEATNTDARSVKAQHEGRHVTGKAGERIRAALSALAATGSDYHQHQPMTEAR